MLTRLGLASPPPPAPSPPFVGRERHLKELHLAFKDTQRGGAVTVLLHGSSGVGKTGLVEHFLSSLRQQQNQVVVLRGRCYERESVPYKALDGLIDNLSRYWRRLPRARAAELLPDDIGPLVRVFPVLLRVEIVADLPRRDADYPDPQELRRRAFAALRQVLRRLGDRWPLVIHLDDLQWGDLDSALMLTALLLPPDAPRLLLLASFRSEDRHTSPFLSSFLQTSVSALGTEPREMALDVLSPQEARDLASRLLVGQDNAYCSNGSQLAQMAEMAARESGGNAFFVYQMVQAMQAGDPEVDLDKVIWNRCLALPENQRRLVEVVALASRPVHGAIALRAAGLGNQGTPNLIDLQKAKWLRPCPGDKVETYHDRIRETVVRHLSLEELTAHHGRLATALEAWGHADAEMLAIHYQGAGNNERAAVKYIIAAGNAADTLAFDQAAKLYRLALELRPVEGEQQIRLLTHLGDALANAGRGAEAAQVYLDAAQCAPPGYVLDLQRRAADQLLRAGRIEEGLDVLQRVLRSVGETYPKTPRRALLALLWGRLRLWWRGAKFRERDASQIPPRELERLDACWTAASILSLTDIIRGLAFHARHYILALQAGDPSRIALALATQAVVHAVTGDPRQNAKAEALLHKVREMATWQGQPYLRGLADNMEGGAALLMGQWKKACELCARAEETFRKECKGAAWERGVACNVRFTAMAATGEFLQVAQELPGLLHEAHERGDLFTATNLRLHAVMLELAADQPQQALQTVQDAMKQWPAQGYHFQHSNEFRFQMLVALYTGQPQQAWQIANAGWPRLQQSLLLRVQSAWAGPKAYMLRAGMANLDGKPALAGELLVKAEAGFLAADMVLYAAVARRCRGLLRGGGEGQELIRTADAAMHAQLIRNPARFTNAVAPGFAEMA
ncbi:MAG TPA: AAA family ATPase [Gemmataceae bacterium]|nr:AAA family ATPase [Gemmataceae bacterium]